MPSPTKKTSLRRMLAGLIILLGLTMILATTMGVSKIPFFDVLFYLLGQLPLMDWIVKNPLSGSAQIILWQIRLPRIVLAVAVGGGLSLCGAAFQGMFKNDLADPYVLGISSGASFGATLAIVFGFHIGLAGVGATSIMAFLGAAGAAVLVYAIAQTGRRLPTTALILSGVAVGFLLNALVTMMMAFRREQIERITMWMMGSFSAASWNQVWVAVPIITAGSVVLFFFARALNILSLGDETANSLGIDTDLCKKIILAICSLVVGACVSVCGVVGFVGLMIPHLTRLLVGADHRGLMPVSVLLGALFLLLSDTAARCMLPFFNGTASELPVGAVTALFGAPFFIWILVRNKDKA